MKALHWYAVALVVAVLSTTGVSAQEQRQFNDHDRQVTNDWYAQHQSHPPRGLRHQDQLSPAQEARLQRGQPFPSDLRRKSYAAPSDLRRQLPPPPAHHRYVVVGRRVALIDDVHHVTRDVIRLH
jgi:Ni/Co efflux regulator RcnB